MKVVGLNTFLCPECAVEMNKVKTESHYGIPMFIEQCPRCGGLWFRDLQAFQVKFSEAEKLDNMDAQKLRNKTDLLNPTLTCPEDNSTLTAFHDPGFPEDLHLQSCPKCGGFWFNRGQFHEFQHERMEKMMKAKDKADIIPQENNETDFDKKIEALLKSQKGDSGYETMGKVGQFLSTPAYTGGGQMAYTPSDDSSGTMEIVMTILKIIFTILLMAGGK